MPAIAPFPALVLAAAAAVALSGCAVRFDLGDDSARRIEGETIPLGGLVALEVTTDNGHVDVMGADVASIQLQAILVEDERGDAGYTVRRTTVGDADVLVVDGECDAGWLDDCSVGFELIVPHDFDVAVHTDNGRVDISSIAGDIDIETDNGRIDGDALGAGQMTAHTDNGAIALDFTEAPNDIDAETDNGAITVRVPDDGEYDVDASSDNGSIDIDVADVPGGERVIRLATDNGAIDVDYGN